MKTNISLLSIGSITIHQPVSHKISRVPLQRAFSKPQTRPFSNALIPTQTLSATRILPYYAKEIFDIIADIGSYPTFIPYLKSSTITSHSSPDPLHKLQWPRTADLHVGYGPYNESFTSTVYCVPYTILEAVAGEAEPTIPADKLPHYFSSNKSHQPQPAHGDLFTSLLTRWTFREFPFKPNPPDGPPQEGNANKLGASPRTEISLHIEVKFASAVYAAVSQAAAPKVAEIMVEAFERRARQVLGSGRGGSTRSEEDADARGPRIGDA